MLAISLQRLSTNKQRYGFDVQTKEIEEFCNRNDLQVIKTYQLRESGGNDNSSSLWDAIDLCKKLDAKLVVSRLCRLTRSMTCLQKILSSGVDLVVVQFGLNASPLLLNLMTSINAYEKSTISLRVKASLQAYKERMKLDSTMKPLGNPKLDEARLKSNESNKRRGKATKDKFIGLITAYRLQGLSYNVIAKEFNKIGLKTPMGKKWHAKSIIILDRR